MIELAQGDIFESGADALVNPVNCVGVMGKGLALEFKHRCPENFDSYVAACRSGHLRPGKALVTRSEGFHVINVPTKRHWSDRSSLSLVESALQATRKAARQFGWPSVAVPALGCGLGGLPWNEVLPRIEDVLGPEACAFKIYPPLGRLM